MGVEPMNLNPTSYLNQSQLLATLTSEARQYLARSVREGFFLQPSRFILGSGGADYRPGVPLPASPDTTDVVNPVFEGSRLDGSLEVEAANASTLVLRCRGPVAPSYKVTEILVYAIARHCALDANVEIPFACAYFPPWLHSTSQRFTTRLVLPLGIGADVGTNGLLTSRPGDTAVAMDSLTVLLG